MDGVYLRGFRIIDYMVSSNMTKPPPDPEGMFAGAYMNELRWWSGAYEVLTWNPESFEYVKLPFLQPVKRSLQDWNLQQAVFTAP